MWPRCWMPRSTASTLPAGSGRPGGGRDPDDVPGRHARGRACRDGRRAARGRGLGRRRSGRARRPYLATVVAVAERWSALTRMDPHLDRLQVLAANVDLVLVTCPADRPSIDRVERETVLAWDAGAQPVVLVTKDDLDDAAALVDALRARLVGVEVLPTSALGHDGIDALAASLATRSHRRGARTLRCGQVDLDQRIARRASARDRHRCATRTPVAATRRRPATWW